MFSATNIHYEISERSKAISCGGIGLMYKLAVDCGLRDAIDEDLHLLKVHLPYHESDHVLNIAFNLLAGGARLDDIERLRNDENYLNALGARRIPDPTTAGDFCRRFEVNDVWALMNSINEVRLGIWSLQPKEFFNEAVIDVDGTLTGTTGECKEGMDISYNGVWGYHPLVVSLANTNEVLFLANRSGNRPSHEGAADYLDQSIVLCRQGGFREVTLRGDTDFSLTKHLDRWDSADVRFVFGYDSTKNLQAIADCLPETAWQRLERPEKYEVKTKPRSRPDNVRERIVQERKYTNLKLNGEDVAEFSYKPTACSKTYRMVVLRKNISVQRGEECLIDEIRYHFYITNDGVGPASFIVFDANQRCNQENLIAQLKDVRALHAPVNGLVSNWAYMVMASLAWTLKSWLALILISNPLWKEQHEKEKERMLRMDFRGFVNSFMLIPTQIVRQGRKIIYRVLTCLPDLQLFFRAWKSLEVLQT